MKNILHLKYKKDSGMVAKVALGMLATFLPCDNNQMKCLPFLHILSLRKDSLLLNILLKKE